MRNSHINWLRDGIRSVAECDFGIKEVKVRKISGKHIVELAPKKATMDCPSHFTDMIGRKFRITIEEIE